MGNYSKMFGAGFGAALAKTLMLFLPAEMKNEATEYVVFTAITAASTYFFPANKASS